MLDVTMLLVVVISPLNMPLDTREFSGTLLDSEI